MAMFQESSVPPPPKDITLTKNGVRYFKEFIGGDKPRPVTLQVVDLRRYSTAGGQFAEACGISPDEDNPYAWDVILTDGKHLLKCLVDLRLQSEIDCGNVLKFSVIKVTKGRYWLDDTKMEPTDPIPIISGFRIVSTLPGTAMGSVWGTIRNGELRDETDIKAHSFEPLIGMRKTYLNSMVDSIHPDDERVAYGDAYRTEITLEPDDTADIHYRCVKLADLLSSPAIAKDACIVARITRKSQVVTLNTESAAGGKYPYQLYLELQDETDMAICVLWYRSAIEYFGAVRPGDVVVLEGFKCRRSTVYVSSYSSAHTEISLSSRNPVGKLSLVPDQEAWGFALPLLSYNFVPHSELSFMVDGTAVDTVGIITHLGRVERRALKPAHKGTSLFRWLTLCDGTLDTRKPIVLCLFAGAQYEEFLTQLAPGQVFACSSCVVRSSLVNSREVPITHIVSTRMSHFTAWFHDRALDADAHPYYGNNAVTRVVEWALKTEEARAAAMASLRDGWLSWPLPPSHCGARRVSNIEEIPLVPFGKTLHAASSLKLLERREIYVMATIARARLWDRIHNNVLTLELPAPGETNEERARVAAPPPKRKRGAPSVDMTLPIVIGDEIELSGVEEGASILSTNWEEVAAKNANSVALPVVGWDIELQSVNKTSIVQAILVVPEGVAPGECLYNLLPQEYRLPTIPETRAQVAAQLAQIRGKRLVFNLSMYRAEKTTNMDRDQVELSILQILVRDN